MFVTGWRNGHEHPCRLVAGVADVVRHARWNEQVCSGPGMDQLTVHLPLAFALQYVEGLFLDTMNVEAGGKAGRQCPVEHTRVLRILSGHEERHRLASQRDFLALTRHSNDRFCAHCAAPWLVCRPPQHDRAASEGPEFAAKLLQNICEWYPLGQWRRSTNLARSASTRTPKCSFAAPNRSCWDDGQ